MTETLIVTVGHGPHPNDPHQPPQSDAEASAFVSEVERLAAAIWGEVVATISGNSSSPWGDEPATWLSVIWEEAVFGTDRAERLGREQRLDLLRAGLAALARDFGQAAIGMVVAGEYVEVPAR